LGGRASAGHQEFAVTALRSLDANEISVLAGIIAKLRPTGAPRWDAPGVRAAFTKVANLDAANVLMAAIRLSQDRSAETPANIAKTNTECWREKVSDWSPPGTRERCPEHEVQLDALNQCRSCAAENYGQPKTPIARKPAADPEVAAAMVAELKDIVAKAKSK
jgi:hypothetical protein